MLSQGAFPFNADEAIVGLMARHILEGNWPIFFYGQAYMGSLDATLVAAVFALTEASVSGIRMVQLLLYGATVYTSVILAKKIFKNSAIGNTVGLLLAIPTVNVLLYTTVSLGGYGEALLIGNLLLILTFSIRDNPERTWRFAAWGVLAGLGFWAFGMSLIYILPTSVFILRIVSGQPSQSRWRSLWRLIAAFFLGSSPWWLWAIQNGPAMVGQELFGSAIAGASSQNLLEAVGSHALNLVLFGPTVILGVRPPWSVASIAKPLIPMVALIWIGFVGFQILAWRRERIERSGKSLIYAVAAVFILGYLLTPFGADPSGRYFVPLTVLLAIPMAGFLAEIRNRFGELARLAALILLVAFNVWGTLESARRNPPGITTQFNQVTQIDHAHMPELVDFLSRQGESVGYTNYWVSYPLAFLSDESIIYVPRLPYHLDFRFTARDDRYASYSEWVSLGSQTAYITTHHSELDAKLRDVFAANEITWQEKVIGDYQVFFDLSDVVRPDAVVPIEN